MGKNHNYSGIGKDIEDALSSGMSTGDWSKLNSAIMNSVDAVLDNVGESIKKYGDIETSGKAKNLSSYKGTYSEGAYTKLRQQKLEEEKRKRLEEARKRQAEIDRINKQKQQMLAKKNPKLEISVPMKRVGSVSGTTQIVAGSVGAGVVVAALLKSIPAMVLGGISIPGLVIGGVCAVGFGAMIRNGCVTNNRLGLAERFAVLGSKKGYIEIEDVSRSTGRSVKQIARDFKKMLKLGFFPQGHIDDDNTNLMFTDKVYEQYRETIRNQRIANQNAIIDTRAKEDEEPISQEEAELKQMIAEGNEYIRRLHELNSKIPGEIITMKLSRLESLLTEIFARVKEHPEQMSKMHELMDYYLPTMIKLVSAYEEYDKVSEPGKDIIDAKSDIENTLDTINEAFKKLLNNLFKDSVWDVTTDAQVLKTVLAQKGLSNGMEE